MRIGQAEDSGKYHVACASRVLVIIPLSALLATNGFIKGVVLCRVGWGLLLISAAEGVWMVTAQVVLSVVK